MRGLCFKSSLGSYRIKFNGYGQTRKEFQLTCSLSECKNADSVSLDIPGGVELTTIPVSTTSEVYMKMNEINLILTTEDGYSQSASISSVNVMTTTDFKSFSGKWSITVPWKIDSVSTVLIAHFGASVNFMSGVDVVIEDGYVCVGKSKYGAQKRLLEYQEHRVDYLT